MNSVDIIGVLKDVIDEYHRKLMYDIPFSLEKDSKVSNIVIRYWTDQPLPRLISLEDSTRVAVHGHLEESEEFGTILLVQQLEVLR